MGIKALLGLNHAQPLTNTIILNNIMVNKCNWKLEATQ